MSNDKRCTQCGILKGPEEFRPYTHSRDKGVGKIARYRICRECEALNSKYKRALAKGDYEESDRINELYIALEALGYRTPKSTKSKTDHKDTDAAVQRILDHHGARAETTVRRDPNHGQHKEVAPEFVSLCTADNEVYMTIEVDNSKDAAAPVPSELQCWIDIDPQEWVDGDLSPEYLQETIYESLKAKYRPQTGVDRNTYTPIYDDTHRATLNTILKKFDDYEESMAQEQYADGIELIEPATLEDEGIEGSE